jgi:hypothetical protein
MNGHSNSCDIVQRKVQYSGDAFTNDNMRRPHQNLPKNLTSSDIDNPVSNLILAARIQSAVDGTMAELTEQAKSSTDFRAFNSSSLLLLRHLLRQIPRTNIIRKKLHVPLPTHPHELLLLPIRRRMLLFLLPQILPIPIPHRTHLDILPIRILLPHLDVRGTTRPLRMALHLPTHIHDLADFDIVDVREQCAFTLDFSSGEIEARHATCEAVGAIGGIYVAHISHPGVFKALVDGDTLRYVDGEHAVDEIECWVANGVPVGRRIVEAAHFDLLRHRIRVFPRVEFVRKGREAAETDIQDDSERPDVDGASIFAVASVLEDFGGDVWEC